MGTAALVFAGSSAHAAAPSKTQVEQLHELKSRFSALHNEMHNYSGAMIIGKAYAGGFVLGVGGMKGKARIWAGGREMTASYKNTHLKMSPLLYAGIEAGHKYVTVRSPDGTPADQIIPKLDVGVDVGLALVKGARVSFGFRNVNYNVESVATPWGVGGGASFNLGKTTVAIDEGSTRIRPLWGADAALKRIDKLLTNQAGKRRSDVAGEIDKLVGSYQRMDNSMREFQGKRLH